MRQLGAVLTLAVLVAVGVAYATEEPERVWGDISFDGESQIHLGATTVTDLVADEAATGWAPAVNSERSRDGLELFAKAAPAVVAVRTRIGHGTGFLVSEDGLILTNNHVVESGASFGRKGSASVVHVHLGRLSDAGRMELLPEPVPALVYKVDPVRDLAVLKLEQLPSGMSKTPSIPFAAAETRPGADCAIIGHPASGLLWTYRSCEIAGLGVFPGDLVNVVIPRLALVASRREEFERELAKQPKQNVIVSSCQANPGDSGGPVLDPKGNLIGVTFAIPADPAQSKFSYHVALSEVRSFLSDVPSTPRLLVPDPWRVGPRLRAMDVLGEGRPQALFAGTNEPEQVLLDLDGDTSPALLRAGDLDALIGDRRFDAEVAIHMGPAQRIAFYDSDNDGHFDLVLVDDDEDPLADQEYRRGADAVWSGSDGATAPWLDAQHLRSKKQADRLRSILRAMAPTKSRKQL